MPIPLFSNRPHLFARFALLILVPLFVLGCQVQDQTKVQTPPPKDPARGNPMPLRWKDLHINSQLTCYGPGSDSCPRAVGELLTFSPQGLGLCTVTLIDADTVLTASHCVPWDSVQFDGRISGNCFVRWPNAESLTADDSAIECERVFNASSFDFSKVHAASQVDYALIKLRKKPLGRKPLPLFARGTAKENFSSSMLIYGVLIDPQNPNVHRIYQKLCAHDPNFQATDLAIDKKSAIVFPKCTVKPGFSGGPIIDLNSQAVVGVISMGRNLPKRQTRKQQNQELPAIGSKIPR